MTLWTMDDEIPRNKPAKGISICPSTPFIWRFPKLGLPPNHPAEVSFPCCWLRGSSVTNLQLCLSRPGRGQGICINKDGPPRDSNLMQHKDMRCVFPTSSNQCQPLVIFYHTWKPRNRAVFLSVCCFTPLGSQDATSLGPNISWSPENCVPIPNPVQDRIWIVKQYDY